jgi:hypothetical protein
VRGGDPAKPDPEALDDQRRSILNAHAISISACRRASTRPRVRWCRMAHITAAPTTPWLRGASTIHSTPDESSPISGIIMIVRAPACSHTTRE